MSSSIHCSSHKPEDGWLWHRAQQCRLGALHKRCISNHLLCLSATVLAQLTRSTILAGPRCIRLHWPKKVRLMIGGLVTLLDCLSSSLKLLSASAFFQQSMLAEVTEDFNLLRLCRPLPRQALPWQRTREEAAAVSASVPGFHGAPAPDFSSAMTALASDDASSADGMADILPTQLDCSQRKNATHWLRRCAWHFEEWL